MKTDWKLWTMDSTMTVNCMLRLGRDAPQKYTVQWQFSYESECKQNAVLCHWNMSHGSTRVTVSHTFSTATRDDDSRHQPVTRWTPWASGPYLPMQWKLHSVRNRRRLPVLCGHWIPSTPATACTCTPYRYTSTCIFTNCLDSSTSDSYNELLSPASSQQRQCF